jgi:hypothetical protein
MYIDPKLKGTKYSGGFMINDPPNVHPADRTTPEQRNAFDCWLKVHNEMLVNGVSTETCAEYFFGLGGGLGGPGFKMKFVPCDTPFIQGEN